MNACPDGMEVCDRCCGTGWSGHPDDPAGRCTQCDGRGGIPQMTVTTELYQAVIALNAAIDAYWNDNERGLGFTGMGEHHMRRITEAQRRCRQALEAEGVRT